MEITTYTSCLSEWKSQTSKHLKVSECDAKSFLLYHKYANTELQTTYLCTQNGGEGLEICLEVLRQLVNYSLIYLVLCLNKWWNDIASRHTLSLGQKKTAAENKWKKKSKTGLQVISDPSGSKEIIKSSKCCRATVCFDYNKYREQRGIIFQSRLSAELLSDWMAASAKQLSLSCCWRGEEHVCLKLEAFLSFCVGWANPALSLTASHPNHGLLHGFWRCDFIKLKQCWRFIHSTTPLWGDILTCAFYLKRNTHLFIH